MAYSYSDLEGLWISAGGSSATAPVAAAIALAESGGNPNAFNGNSSTGDQSYGLWQINMLGSLGAPRRQEFGISNNTQLFDPATNAAAAVKVANGGSSFTPWTTFTDGAYRKFLNTSTPPNLSSGTGGATATQTGFLGLPSVSDVEHAVLNILNYVFFFSGVIGGIVLIAVGLILLVKDTAIDSTAAATRNATTTVLSVPRNMVT